MQKQSHLVIPATVWLDAIDYVQNYQVFEQGYTAVESRMRDGGSGKVIATVEVGEGGRGSSGPGFTWWGHSRSTIKYFAQTFENIVADGWQERVSSRSPFTLVTW